MMKIIYLVILTLLGCSNEGIKSRTVENYYQSAGVEKYFLTELPEWANFSESGSCYRRDMVRYFDLNALMKSYSINYKTAIQIQATYNDEFVRLTKKMDSVIPFAEEQLIFFRASDKVNSKILFFDPPTFKRVHLIWIDNIDPQKVKKFLKSPTQDKGIPVLMSLCMTKNEIEDKFSENNYKIISAEMFSVFDIAGQKIPAFSLSLDQIFQPDQELILYSPVKIQELKDLKGKFQIVQY